MELNKIVKTVEFEGFTILIGRNAEMNDILTTEIAEPNDIWLHASGVPGSHVVIKVVDEKPPKVVIKEAAKLAAKNSKGKGKVDVVYTAAKNVTKNSKQPTGQVTVDYSKSTIIKAYAE